MSNYCDKGHWEAQMTLPCKQCEIESLRKQRNDLLEAVDNLVNVKGRHNTEIAWKRMADLVKELKALKEQWK